MGHNIFRGDWGYISELITRIAVMGASEGVYFVEDMWTLFSQFYTDWYMVGLRVGMIWKLSFDLELPE